MIYKMWNVYFYVQILKVITKVKQNLKLEKENKIVAEVRKILCLTARFDSSMYTSFHT